MVRNLVMMMIIILGVGLFLGMSEKPEGPSGMASDQGQDAFQKFIANTGRYYVAMFTAKGKPDVLALLDKGELQKLDQSGKLEALLQGERGGVLIVLSAMTSEEARVLAGPVAGKAAKSVSLTIRPAIVSKSFTDVKGRKPALTATMESFEAAYSMKGKSWVPEGNETSRKVIPEHVGRIGSLFEKGIIKMYLSFEDSEDPRGFFVFSGKSREEIRATMADDPVVKANWVTFDFLSCKAPEGTFK